MKARRIVAAVAGAAVVAAISAPAVASGPWNGGENADQHRSAFAGAVLRLRLDGRGAGIPQARLGFGFTHYQRAASGALMAQPGVVLPVEAGFAAGRPQLFVGGESLSAIDRRLGMAGSSSNLLILGGVVIAGGVALLLLSGDDDDAPQPCPPGVEVCAF